MKKKLTEQNPNRMGLFKKTLLVMKLTSFMLLVLMLQVNANSFSQNAKVTLSLKETSLEKVFKEIQDQTNLDFFYSAKYVDLSKKVSIDFKDAKLDKVMNQILGKNYSIEYRDNIIIITAKKNVEKEVVQNNRIIKGQVKDKQGVALPGVSVYLKGYNLGASTDIDGKYELKIPNDKKQFKLVFSFVGMKTKTVLLTDKNEYNITLEDNVSGLDEVVCNGYKKIDKRKSSSAVVSVKGDAIKEGASISVDKMLQGKLAGVSVINQSSTPGAAPKIRIRGASSISGNREPVWVVDGVILEDPVPVSTEELNSFDNVNIIGNAISSINPEDIDRIDILKDASATAIYGVKAANGVIVITTKKGEYGAAKVKYSNNFSVTMSPTMQDMHRMNSKDRIEVSEEMQRRSLTFGSTTPGDVGYEGALKRLWNKEISYDQFRREVKQLKETNTDWYDLLFRNAFSQSHNVTVSGADDKTNYYFSGGFSDNKGSTLNVGLKRYNVLMKLNSKLTKNLRVAFKLNGSVSENKRPHSSIDLYEYAFETSRAIKAYEADGSYSYYNKSQGYLEPLKYNVFNELDNSGQVIENQSLGMNFTLDWNFAKGFRFNSMLSYIRNNNYIKNWANDQTHYIAELRRVNYGTDVNSLGENFIKDKCKLPYGGELESSNTKSTTYTFRNSVSYFKTINDIHEFSSNIGTEVRSVTYDGLKTVQRGYLPGRGKKSAVINPVKWETYADWLKGNTDDITDNTTNTVSMYGTFTYTFDKKYTLNYNIRTDGSNKFGQDDSVKFLPVWSISGRWNVHQENLLKNVMWLNRVALRASYGVQGNVHPDQTPNLIVKMGTLNDMVGEFESTLHKLPNHKLKWEKTKSYNFGCEFALFNNKVFGTFDIYRKKGVDQVITKDVSVTTGASSVALNAGDVENKGWEMSVNFSPIKTKDFEWGLSANASKNENTITNAGSNIYTYQDYLAGNAIINGKPINGFYSYKFDKLDENGLPTFKDIEETEGISKEEMFAKVFTYSGSRLPDFTGGISSTFRYKNLTLSCLFSYSFGSKIRFNNLYESSGQQLPNPQQNMSSDFVDRWRQKGDEANTNIPALSNEDLVLRNRNIEIASNKWEMYNMSDLRVVSGDFIRLRNVGLRYRMPKVICKKIFVKNMNLRFEASNLFVWTKDDLNGRDPEQITFGTGTIPPAKTFTFGLDVTF